MNDLGRLVRVLRAIVRKLTAHTAYHAMYEYRVVAQSGDRLDLAPARPSNGLPPLSQVPVRYGFPGARATYAAGGSVLVAFADGDPSRPVVIAHTAPDDSAADPSLIQLADTTESVAVGTEAGRVLRFGDVIMMPVGQPPVPTATLILGAKLGDVTTPLGPIDASIVKA